MSVYLRNTEIVGRVKYYLGEHHRDGKSHHLNILFYIALAAAARALNNAHVPPNKLVDLDLASLTDQLLDDCFAEVFTIYDELGRDDKAAKGADMARELIAKLEADIHGKSV